jgi:hypothetical protein
MGGGGGFAQGKTKEEKVVQKGKAKKNTFTIRQKIPAQAHGQKKFVHLENSLPPSLFL